MRSREGLKFLKHAFTETPCTFDGKYYQYKDTSLSPQPVQSQIPLWYCAGQQAKTVLAAAEAGYNLWLPPATAPAKIAELIKMHYDAAKAAGHDADSLGTSICSDVAIAETKGEAKRIVDEEIMPYYVEQIIGFGFLTDEDGKPMLDLKLGDPAYEVMADSIIWGTPEEVIKQIEPMVDLGITCFMPRLFGVMWNMRHQTERMELFSKKVMPHFA